MSCIQPGGKYCLTNVKGGTCLDLSGGDNRSIIGYGYHSGPNQVWIFEPEGQQQTYYLRSDGSGQYLGAAGEPVRDGTKVIADVTRYAWRVEDVGNSQVRLLPATNPNFCVDLSNYGSDTPGTPVELWGRWEGENQCWRLRQIQ